VWGGGVPLPTGGRVEEEAEKFSIFELKMASFSAFLVYRLLHPNCNMQTTYLHNLLLFLNKNITILVIRQTYY